MFMPSTFLNSLSMSIFYFLNRLFLHPTSMLVFVPVFGRFVHIFFFLNSFPTMSKRPGVIAFSTIHNAIQVVILVVWDFHTISALIQISFDFNLSFAMHLIMIFNTGHGIKVRFNRFHFFLIFHLHSGFDFINCFFWVVE